MQNQLSIKCQIQTGSEVVDGTVKLELINTWMLTCEISCIGVIAVLSIVDDLTEFDRLPGCGEVVAQFHREGNFLHSARRSREASRTTWSSGSCVKKNTVIPT